MQPLMSSQAPTNVQMIPPPQQQSKLQQLTSYHAPTQMIHPPLHTSAQSIPSLTHAQAPMRTNEMSATQQVPTTEAHCYSPIFLILLDVTILLDWLKPGGGGGGYSLYFPYIYIQGEPKKR